MSLKSTLANLHSVLAQQAACHPRLSIAYANLWLDPLHMDDVQDHLEYDEGEDAIAATALSVCRNLYPDTYYGMLHRLRHCQGYGPDQVIDDFKNLIHAEYPFIPIDELDDYYTICHDVPMPFYGWCPWDDDYGPTVRSDWIEILAALCLQPEGSDDDTDENEDEEDHPAHYDPDRTTYDEVAWDVVLTVVIRPLLKSLIHLVKYQNKEQPYTDLAFMLMRLFMISGNSSIDQSAEQFYESGFQPMEWSKDNLEFANIICAEASLMLEASERGLERLETDPTLFEELKRLAALLHTCHKKGVPLTYECLPWTDRPAAKRGTPDYPGRETAAYTAVLYLRSNFDTVPR